jgi:DNA repair exonuclease SbcCD ATPase subunit
MSDLQILRTNLERQKGSKQQIEKSIAENIVILKEAKRSLHRHEEAKEIIRSVGQITQSQISFHISDITSLAMEAVFKEPYQLKIDFVQRRNKTECDLSFEREGVKVDPLTASGGGAVDVAAFALRIASWTMMNPRSRNTIILDEPFRFLSGDNQERASAMVKEISQKLGIQMIVVTHSETLASYADRTFTVSIRNKISRIKVS